MNEWLNFTGKVALVTSAASGMGLATARAGESRRWLWA
jgi:NAD(P)-dependent dehydrogenase (short-subunit alcohol dehydrogenase family)